MRTRSRGFSASSCSSPRSTDGGRAPREAVEKVIDFSTCSSTATRLIVNLPYGVRKVVELARALCTAPKLLLLDEPSSGLNVEETEDMAFWIEDIQKLGITVLMVEHDMKLVRRVGQGAGAELRSADRDRHAAPRCKRTPSDRGLSGQVG